MTEQMVNLNVEDGTLMQGFAAVPEGEGPFPGIIVLQEAFGVNNYIKNVTKRFRDEGYIAIAPELYHRSAGPGFVASYTDFPATMQHLQAITLDGLSYDLEAAYNWLTGQEKIAINNIYSIGFCLGGRASFVANGILPLKSAISFYGTGIPELMDRFARDLSGPQLFIWGEKDNHIPLEQVEKIKKEMKHIHKPYKSRVFADAGHGFFCDEKEAYNPKAADQAWQMTLDFLKENGG